MDGVCLFEKFDFRISRHSEIEGLDFRKLKSKRDEQNRQKELPTNKANGNQKSLGHLKGAKTIAR